MLLFLLWAGIGGPHESMFAQNVCSELALIPRSMGTQIEASQSASIRFPRRGWDFTKGKHAISFCRAMGHR
jgi:hypothetical protein